MVAETRSSYGDVVKNGTSSTASPASAAGARSPTSPQDVGGAHATAKATQTAQTGADTRETTLSPISETTESRASQDSPTNRLASKMATTLTLQPTASKKSGPATPPKSFLLDGGFTVVKSRSQQRKDRRASSAGESDSGMSSSSRTVHSWTGRANQFKHGIAGAHRGYVSDPASTTGVGVHNIFDSVIKRKDKGKVTEEFPSLPAKPGKSTSEGSTSTFSPPSEVDSLRNQVASLTALVQQLVEAREEEKKAAPVEASRPQAEEVGKPEEKASEKPTAPALEQPTRESVDKHKHVSEKRSKKSRKDGKLPGRGSDPSSESDNSSSSSSSRSETSSSDSSSSESEPKRMPYGKLFPPRVAHEREMDWKRALERDRRRGYTSDSSDTRKKEKAYKKALLIKQVYEQNLKVSGRKHSSSDSSDTSSSESEKGRQPARRIFSKMSEPGKYSGSDERPRALVLWAQAIRNWLLTAQVKPDSLEAAGLIGSCLSGRAKELYWREVIPVVNDKLERRRPSSTSPWSFAQIVELLRSRFVSESAVRDADAQFEALRQRQPDGSVLRVVELSQRLKDLGEERQETTAHQMKKQFINALLPELAAKTQSQIVIDDYKVTYDEVVEVALHEEKIWLQRQALKKAQQTGRSISNYASYSASGVYADMARGGKRDRNERNRREDRGLDDRGRDPKSRRRDHQQRDRERKKEDSKANRLSPAELERCRKEKLCFNCKSPEHSSRDCPKKKAKVDVMTMLGEEGSSSDSQSGYDSETKRIVSELRAMDVTDGDESAYETASEELPEEETHWLMKRPLSAKDLPLAEQERALDRLEQGCASVDDIIREIRGMYEDLDDYCTIWDRLHDEESYESVIVNDALRDSWLNGKLTLKYELIWRQDDDDVVELVAPPILVPQMERLAEILRVPVWADAPFPGDCGPSNEERELRDVANAMDGVRSDKERTRTRPPPPPTSDSSDSDASGANEYSDTESDTASEGESITLDPDFDHEMVRAIASGYENDKTLGTILQAPERFINYTVKRYEPYEVDLLYQRPEEGAEWALCIPPRAAVRGRRVVEVVLEHAHELLGHAHARSTLAWLQKLFWWPKMSSETEKYVKSCSSCQLAKPSTQLPPGFLHPRAPPSRPYEQISIDFQGPYVPSWVDGKEYDFLFNVMDTFSGEVILIPTKEKELTARRCAELFFRHVYPLWGLPQQINSDLDVRWTSEFWRALFGALRTTLATSTAYHPQSNGKIENMHRSLNAILRQWVTDTHSDWAEYIHIAQFAINCRKSSTTGFAPFELTRPSMPLHVPEWATLNATGTAAEMLNALALRIEKAKDATRAARIEQARQANKRRMAEALPLNSEGTTEWLTKGPAKPGQLYLVSSENLRPMQNRTKKLLPHWIGPFSLVSYDPETSTYELALHERYTRRGLGCRFHASLVRKYVPSDETLFPNRISNDDPIFPLDDATPQLQLPDTAATRGIKRMIDFSDLDWAFAWQGAVDKQGQHYWHSVPGGQPGKWHDGHELEDTHGTMSLSDDEGEDNAGSMEVDGDSRSANASETSRTVRDMPTIAKQPKPPPPPPTVEELARRRDAEAAAAVQEAEKNQNISRHATSPLQFGGRLFASEAELPDWLRVETPVTQNTLDLISKRFRIKSVDGHRLEERLLRIFTTLEENIPDNRHNPRYIHEFDIEDGLRNGYAAILDGCHQVKLYLARRGVRSVSKLSGSVNERQEAAARRGASERRNNRASPYSRAGEGLTIDREKLSADVQARLSNSIVRFLADSIEKLQR
ncbi:hypothetical protein JCM10908_002607 [Rhodotorula pacifica]|uniref:uncharacterized protein n=1 Tax=Rhodotorula pacifica TaxID=1495444 RepID=UPI00317417FC